LGVVVKDSGEWHVDRVKNLENLREKALQKLAENKSNGKVAGNPMTRFKERFTARNAIKAKCWECMGGTEEGGVGVRAMIRECQCGPESMAPCPLWAFRAYK